MPAASRTRHGVPVRSLGMPHVTAPIGPVVDLRDGHRMVRSDRAPPSHPPKPTLAKNWSRCEDVSGRPTSSPRATAAARITCPALSGDAVGGVPNAQSAPSEVRIENEAHQTRRSHSRRVRNSDPARKRIRRRAARSQSPGPAARDGTWCHQAHALCNATRLADEEMSLDGNEQADDEERRDHRHPARQLL
jgi:hypothetical protein